MMKNTKRFGKAGLLAIAVCLGAGLANHAFAQQQPAPPAPSVAPAPGMQNANLSPDQELFTAFGETATAGDFETLIRFNPPSPLDRFSGGMIELNDVPVNSLREGIREHVIMEAIARDAKAEGFELPEDAQARLDRELEAVAYRVWLEEAGVFSPAALTDEEAKAQYEEEKEKYKREEQLTLRHIFLSTYKEYTVQEGDTLESIAEEAAGDPEKIDQILDNDTKQPRNEPLEGAEDAGPQPLQVGEILLVPMNTEEAQAVAQKAQEAYGALESGKSFEEAAAEIGAAAPSMMSVRPKADDKPVLPEIREAFESIEDNAYSEPIRTKHGYQIIYRVRYQEEGYTPFENVKAQIKARGLDQKRKEVLEQRVGDLWAKDESIAIDEEVLANVFDDERGDDIIMKVGDVNYLASQFVRDFGGTLDESSTLEQRREILQQLPMMRRHLILNALDTEGIRETETYIARSNMLRNRNVAMVYANVNLSNIEVDATEEEIAAKFEEMRPQYEQQPSAKIYQITVTPELTAQPGTPQFQQELNVASEKAIAQMGDIASLEQFQEAARQISDDEYAEQGGEVGVVGATYQGNVGASLARAEVGKLLGPSLGENNNLHWYWVAEKYETSDVSLDDVREELTRTIENEERQGAYQDLRERMLDEAGLEIHIGNEIEVQVEG